MPTRGSRASYNLPSFLQLIYRSRLSDCSYRQGPGVAAAAGFGGYSRRPGLQLFSVSEGTWRTFDTNKVKNEMNKVRAAVPISPPAPSPPNQSHWFNFSVWARWLLGSLLSVLLPFWRVKWEKLKRIEGEAEVVVKEVECAAEVVKQAAIATEKLSAEVAEKLPEQSNLKKAAMVVEHISQVTANDAQSTSNFFRKVDELKEDLEDLETMVQPVIDKIIK